MVRILFALLVLVAALGAARSAAAQTGTPAQRAAATAYAEAAHAYTKATWEARPAMAAALETTRADRVQCRRLKSALERTFIRDESAAGERLFLVTFLRGFSVLEGPVLPVKERFVAALDAVQGADTRLRAGREIWRWELALSRALTALPVDTCARLVAWDRGGRRGLPLGDVDLSALESFFADDEDAPSRIRVRARPSADPLTLAVRRLRALGQGPVRAARFGGDPARRASRPFLDDVARDLGWISELIFKDFD